MNLSEVLGLRRPVLDPVERVLNRCVTVEDVRAAALRRWPEVVRGYVESGADGELSVRRNRQAYEDYALMPLAMRDVSRASTGTTLLGQPVSAPLALGPTGYTRMMHGAGEPAVARAARDAGLAYTLATLATTSIEDLARDVPGTLWFQLYLFKDRGLTRELLDRAQASGYRALFVTVDSPVVGLRVREHRDGCSMPPRRLSVPTLLGMARHPVWAARTQFTRASSTYANLKGTAARTSWGAADFEFEDALSWDDVAQIRQLWSGPLVVKGLLRADDAVRAAEAGADAVVLSNHGGRQLDQALAPLHALPEVVDALQNRIEVLIDSGIRRGTDIALALALGANGVLIGRPYLYGLAAGGERGVATVIGILLRELRRAMQLMGVSSVEELRREGPGLVRIAGPRPQPAYESVARAAALLS